MKVTFTAIFTMKVAFTSSCVTDRGILLSMSKESRYLRASRRMLTEAEQVTLAHNLTVHGGVFVSRRVRPSVLGTAGKTVAFAAVAGLLWLLLGSGMVPAAAKLLGPGISGRVTVTSCEVSGKRQLGCEGTFRAGRADPLVIEHADILGLGTVRAGQVLDGRVAGPDSTDVFVFRLGLLPLAVFVLLAGVVFLLLLMVVHWPVRMAVHLWRPDLWPYWVGPRKSRGVRARTPRSVRMLSRITTLAGPVLFSLATLAYASIFGVSGVMVWVVVVGGMTVLFAYIWFRKPPPGLGDNAR